MPYAGPAFKPTSGDISIWSWNFERPDSVPRADRGFRDATTGDFISFKELKEAAIAASKTLSEKFGIGPKKTVAIVAHNSISYPVALMAVGRLGATVTALPAEAKHEDLAYFFQESLAEVFFADSGALAEVQKAAQSMGLPASSAILLDGRQDGILSLEHLIQQGKISKTVISPAASRKSSCAFLAFTSGTTSRPKAVMISHQNIIDQLRQVQMCTPPGKSSTVLGILPFFHITGLVQLIHLPLVLDQDLVVMDKFDMTLMMQTIVKYRCTELWLVPPLLIRLLNDRAAQGYDLSFVEQFNTGAAPLSEQVILKLATRFPKVHVRQAWGMTETTSCVTVTPPGLTTWDNAGKVGKLVPGTLLRIVDPETGADVARGSIGELWVRGPQVTLGYLNCPEETLATYIDGGYLRTGDLGAIDQDGFITIHDRIKEMIKVRGHAVAPAELEDLLLSHSNVADAAVIGVPDDYSGELPRAYIVPRQNLKQSQCLEKEIYDFVDAKKPKYKRLAGGVSIVAAIPKSASGKILRRVLKDQWKACSDMEQMKKMAKI